MKFLVSGATGFVGRHLCQRLLDDGHYVKGTVLASETTPIVHCNFEPIIIEPMESNPPLEPVLNDVDVVIHLAARVHIMRETETNPLEEFRKVNLYGTEHLLRQAAQAGVKRFVFLSTIGVNGDNSGENPYTEQSPPRPHNPYSRSKYEAEQAIRKISAETGIEIVIIRAPIVYGPGNPGNFLTLLRIVSWGVPLPLGSLHNMRSLIYVGNLVDVLTLCSAHPNAAGRTFLVSDGEDLSTPDLIYQTADALRVRALLFKFPPALMRMAGILTGKSGLVNRLAASLTVDSSSIRQELGWRPPYPMREGLRETASFYNRNKDTHAWLNLRF